MVMTAPKQPKSDKFLVPAGTIQAVCYDIWDIGWQKTEWNGEEKVMPKVIIAFEVNKRIEEGKFKDKRYGISKRYTFSFGNKANLTKDVESWLNRKMTESEKETFDLETMIGKNCLLGITHSEKNGNNYANITSIMPLMEDMPEITAENPRGIPDWVKEVQSKAVKYNPETEIVEEPLNDINPNEEIPF